ncbi:MAG TPA: PSD1 and planctomycete cytochrome C domain-containing protein [Bryobacteraceae bacterium]|jgi:mono/diheme cytochrome c family protein|nr:PSD1 and planctomycete cytochrome C domain-containing protein [Bryobacteraceae bacterium]
MHKLPLACLLLAGAATAGLALHQTNGAAETRKIDFVRDVQPIFTRSCIACHGPNTQMGGLRLDAKQSVLAKVVVPGNPAQSALYRRVAGIGDVARMPMGGRLADDQIATLKAWIEQGAEWPDSVGAKVTATKVHWAFIPPQRPALPDVKNQTWAKNPIDRFILARLEKEGLTPSPEADRVTLLRRLSLDLIGLPPTAEEVDAFVHDGSSDAYEKQVDRLLGSPHYGEMWGRHWLDAAHYADSDGYEKDKPREVWFYRDWVIQAFNSNLPYNRFIVDQIAGDLLPHHTQGEVVATGFLRNSQVNEEGGVDPEQFRMEAMFDRMNTVGSAILGLTIRCAQCHDHKYDPLKQEEYYKMMAFLNSADEANIAVYTPSEEMRRTAIVRRTREIEGTLQRRNKDWSTRMAAWEQRIKQDQPEWIVVRPEVDDISTGGEKYYKLPDGSLLAQGYAPTQHTVKLTVKTDVRNIRAFRLELLKDPNLPRGGPGRSVIGTGVLTDFKVEASPADAPDKKSEVKIVGATADINLPETKLDPVFNDKSKKSRVTGQIEYAIDGKDETGWGIDAGPGLRNQPRKAVFNAAEPIGSNGPTILVFYLAQKHGGWNSDDNQNNNLGRIRLSITTSENASADPLPAAVREILAVPSDQRTPEQVQTVFSYWRTTVPEWRQQNEQIASLWSSYPEGSSQLVLAQREQGRQTHVLSRGDFLKPAKLVDAGTPAYLNPLPQADSRSVALSAVTAAQADSRSVALSAVMVDRLAFANWLVDRKAPTTARAWVNRVWQTYFGTGIVATSEDLGTQCEPPSHPELLDWLAVQFMDSGWDVKALQRLIVTSAAYRQSSNVTPAQYDRDPYNRLLARGPRFRVDGEVVRDITLAASGLLNPSVGGPSVYPPAPAFLFQPPVSYSPKNWYESKGPDRYRRAVYTFRYRSLPYPMLDTFDTPNGDSSCVRRARSDTPLQALTTLNEPLSMETARALAWKTLREGGSTDADRVRFAFRRCVSREPDAKERAALQDLLTKEEASYKDGKHNPWELAADDPAKPPALPAGMSPADAAAWTVVSRVLLNLDETITKE